MSTNPGRNSSRDGGWRRGENIRYRDRFERRERGEGKGRRR